MKRRSNFARFGEYLNTHYPAKTKNEQDEGDKQSQTQAILSRFKHDDEQSQIHSDVFDTFMGVKPLRQPPPDDLPAIEKIKIFARAGFLSHYAGTLERFESIWAEAFPEEGKGGKK